MARAARSLQAGCLRSQPVRLSSSHQPSLGCKAAIQTCQSQRLWSETWVNETEQLRLALRSRSPGPLQTVERKSGPHACVRAGRDRQRYRACAPTLRPHLAVALASQRIGSFPAWAYQPDDWRIGFLCFPCANHTTGEEVMSNEWWVIIVMSSE